ncbi:hypothetical protein X777_08223 [Ooceraea biroi]|uniref:Uncharacterized protein n=1 Tax=Ooceraea biroi TaxID=2015173 RepID=A0A026WZ37_OOCBI|nr:hypothetical protein X777_08223 [Ooceraea biroi]
MLVFCPTCIICKIEENWELRIQEKQNVARIIIIIILYHLWLHRNSRGWNAIQLMIHLSYVQAQRISRHGGAYRAGIRHDLILIYRYLTGDRHLRGQLAELTSQGTLSEGTHIWHLLFIRHGMLRIHSR